jgi:hypothetical protein
MKHNVLLFFSLFFFLQTSCMFTFLLGPKEQKTLDMSQVIPVDVIGHVIGNLDYKENMQFIRTCKTFYSNYAENDILLTPHCLNSNDYTGAMVHFSRKNDAKKIELLMQYEGEVNKNNREDILKHFGVHCGTELQNVIEIYKKKYDKENIYNSVSVCELVTKYVPVFQLLLKQGYDPNIKYSNEGLLDRDVHGLGLRDDDWRDYKARPVLHCAVHNICSLNLLLAHPKVDINIKNDRNGETVLHYAACRNDIKVLRRILAHPKVDINAKDDRNCETVLHYAVCNNDIKILRLILAHPKVDINATDKWGNTVLHKTVFSNNIEGLRILIADGRVDQNIKNNNGLTACRAAEDPEAIKILSDYNRAKNSVIIKNKIKFFVAAGGTICLFYLFINCLLYGIYK